MGIRDDLCAGKGLILMDGSRFAVTLDYSFGFEVEMEFQLESREKVKFKP